MTPHVPPPASLCPRPHHLPRCSNPLHQASRWIPGGFKKPHSSTSRERNHDVKKRHISSFVCQMVQARENLDSQQTEQKPAPRPGSGVDWAATQLLSGQTELHPKVCQMVQRQARQNLDSQQTEQTPAPRPGTAVD